MAVRGVIFDLWDTLVSQEPMLGSPSNRAGAALLAGVIERGGLMPEPPAADQLAESLGEALQEALIETYTSQCALPDVREVFGAVFDRFEWEPPAELIELMLPVYFRPFFESMRPADQAAPVLALLRKAGLRTAIIANLLYGEDLLLQRLRTLGILPSVDACVLSTESGWFKPHPVPYREARTRLGFAAADTVMVGDDWDFDVRTPQRMGMRAVWLRRPGATLPDGVAPDAVIDGLGDLLPAIAALEASGRVA